MHIFSHDFLRNELLPAQLVTLATNISSLRMASEFRKEKHTASYGEMELAAKIESVKAVLGELVRGKRVKILGTARATKYLRA